MLPDKGTIPQEGIANILNQLAAKQVTASLLLVRDYDMCKLYIHQGRIVHTEFSQMDSSQPSELRGEAGLRLIAKLLQWGRGVYTLKMNEAAPAQSTNLAMDWNKVASDLNGENNVMPAAEVQKTGFGARLTGMFGRSKQKNDTQVGFVGDKTLDVAVKTVESADLSSVPMKLQRNLYQTIVDERRNDITKLTQTHSLKQDKRALMFDLIDGRRSIRDLAVSLGWSIEEVKGILSQLAYEGVVEMNRTPTLVS